MGDNTWESLNYVSELTLELLGKDKDGLKQVYTGVPNVSEAHPMPEIKPFRVWVFSRELFEDPKGTEVKNKLLQRGRDLASQQINGVSTPIQIDEYPTGEVFVVERYLGEPLSSLLRKDQGLAPEKEPEEILRQAVDALAQLHARGVQHGDIRPERVYVINNKSTQRPQVTLGDVVWGPLPFWTKGRAITGNMTPWLPPEWQDSPQEPEKTADVYALGLVGCALFLGLEAIENRESISEKILRNKGASSQVARLLVKMINQDPNRRLSDGCQAAMDLRPKSAWMPGWIVAGLAVLSGSGLLWNMRANLSAQNLETQITQLSETYKITESEKNQLQREIDDLNAQLARASQEVAPVPAPGHAEEAMANQARSFWEQYRPVDPFENSNWTQIRKRIDQHAVAAEQAILDEWYAVCCGDERPGVWIRCDRELERTYRALVDQPWESDRRREFRNQDATVLAAARRWKQWAENPNLTWRDMGERIDNTNLVSSEQAVLRRWYDAIKNYDGPWTLNVYAGRAPEGFKTYRVIYIYSGSNEYYSEGHDWRDPLSHRYTDQGEQPLRIRFLWSPEETLDVTLYGEYGWIGRHQIFKDSLPGPVPIWLLSSRNCGSQTANLRCTVDNCPGPPIRMIDQYRELRLTDWE